jgi:RHS repeat-associated protein
LPPYVDALILRDRDSNGDGTLDERLWVVQDANYNVTALFDNLGNVVERYFYDPFGQVTVLDASWTERAGSAFGWFHLHQGGRLDATSGLYHFRHRDYSPTLGRWTSLDPLRYDAGDVNLYRALGNSPTNTVDPSGLLWSWLSAAAGAVIGAGVGVVGYVGFNLITGRPITWGGVAGAAAGGAVAGGIAGGLAGAVTGDPSALAVIGGGVLLGAGSGAAGGFTSSVVSQGIDQGQINWGQVWVDTGTGAAIGGVTGGVLGGGKVLLRPPRGGAPARPRLPGQWDSDTYPKPPGWNPNWRWGPATGEADAGWRWFDPQGGEWRWHAPDRWHPHGHWDYNPWTDWNSPWRNVPVPPGD